MNGIETKSSRLAKYFISLAYYPSNRDGWTQDHVLHYCPFDRVHEIRLPEPISLVLRLGQKQITYFRWAISPTTELATEISQIREKMGGNDTNG